ncbi:germination lipoprotein GerS-related protein [Haloimpatiens sp. FM7330]|uniref:germination lipoprotein GerS-related protein n=1 Tax=Haloimpatiens sp. FM7330 TaxID=3298610 RepID=UPI003643A321
MKNTKKVLILILIIVLCVISILYFKGKGKKTNDMNDVTNILKEIKSYTSDVDIEIVNDKQTLKYKIKQTYSKNEIYKIRLENNRVLSYEKGNIYVDDIENNRKYVINENLDSVFKLTFIEKYIKLLYTNENIKYNYKDVNGKKYVAVTLDLPGMNKNLSKGVLYIENKTQYPSKLIIYDENNKERIRITYKNLKVNILK